jgi:hypothetical protein
LENFTACKNNFLRESYGSFSRQRSGYALCQRGKLEGRIKFRFFWGFAWMEKEVECLNNSREKSENKKGTPSIARVFLTAL